MEAGWGMAFLERFEALEDDGAIATVLTRDNREFLARKGEIEVLSTFPTAWSLDGRNVIPESEIVRVEIAATREPE